MKRLIFTGAQGTGKTTILNHFKNEGYNVITEVVRNLSKEGVKINEMGDESSQARIYDEYVKLLSEKKDYISDRGLSDVLGYTAWLENKQRVSTDLLAEQIERFRKFDDENQDILYFYFPIEFDVVDDGVRSVDEEFRRKIDYNIKNVLIGLNIPYIEVKGTVEQRIKIVEDAMIVG